jgi:shikimate kinase
MEQTEVLRQLSALGRLVVATGGGAVIEPHNWWVAYPCVSDVN